MKKLFIPIALIVALAVGVYVFLRPSNAPDVTLTALDGHVFNTKDLRGKVVLVNFWATTCTTCMNEMPKIIDTHKQFNARGYETIAVAMEYDNPEWIRDFSKRANLPFVIAQDKGGIAAKAFGDVQLTPTTFLIDKHGRIVKQYLGAPDFGKLHALLDKLLAEPA